MSISSSDWPITNTEHGMLVAFGEFLRQHGLLERLRQVPAFQTLEYDLRAALRELGYVR